MIGLLLAVSPAQAWDNGTFLRTGDVFCTDQTRSDTGVRFLGHITNGSATASIRTSATAGGAEAVVWTQSAANIDFTASDLDYAFVGTVFSTTGATVDTVFVAGPDLTLLKMCVYSSSTQTLTASYELSAAG